MNREKLPSIWVYGGIYLGEGDFSIIYGENKDENLTINKYLVYTETVGQYTGINDSKDKMIFTDDILLNCNGDIGIIKFGAFYDTELGVDIYGYYWNNNSVVNEGVLLDENWSCNIIIGNIFDNMDLLYK